MQLLYSRRAVLIAFILGALSFGAGFHERYKLFCLQVEKRFDFGPRMVISTATTGSPGNGALRSEPLLKSSNWVQESRWYFKRNARVPDKRVLPGGVSPVGDEFVPESRRPVLVSVRDGAGIISNTRAESHDVVNDPRRGVSDTFQNTADPNANWTTRKELAFLHSLTSRNSGRVIQGNFDVVRGCN